MEILNLVPGSIYHICVQSISAANFQTPSAVIHVRTKSLPASQPEDIAHSSAPTIRASIPRSTAGLPAPSAPQMTREHSGGPLQKRSSIGRRQSPAAGTVDISQSHPENPPATYEHNEDINLLADRLKNLQHDNENVEKQTIDEDEEHVSLLKDLEKQRDELKKRVREKDEASGDLKKHVNKLESVNRTVQSDKAKRERVLQQKDADRQRRKNDIARWLDQVVQIHTDTAHARQEKARLEEQGKKRADEVREKIAKEQAEMKAIDDEIQDKGGRVKKLEDERKGYTEEDGEDGNELDRIDNERARQWELKLSHLQARYASLVNLHTQAQQQYQEAQDRFKWLNSQRAGAAPFSLPPMDLDLPSGATIRPPRRHRSSLNSNVSSPMNFPSLEPFPSNLNYNPPTTSSPTFAPASSFFNINNGMTFPGLTTQPESLRRGSDFSVTNPQMSPRADALLPSDLLGDEESPDLPRPIIRPRFSDLEQPPAHRDSFPADPSSPDSANKSRPTSLLASPEEKQKPAEELQSQTVPLGDSNEAPKSASRRLSGLFNFNRPRGKTLAEEPPLLGTLKQGQSQSFPREMDEIDPIGPRRRRLSYTTSWANPISFLPRNNTTGATPDSSSDHVPSRRTAFSSIFSSSRFGFGSGNGLNKGEGDLNSGYNQFSPRHDPIDPSSILGQARRRGSLSPRPSSTFSIDNQLPHPSTDNRHFGWPSADKSGHRSPLGFDWTSPSTWSRTQSRRPSTGHYGSSGNLPLGFSGDPDYVEDPSFERQGRPLQAPIGTRPSSSHRPITPKLNPAAPTFRTIFGGKKSDKKEEKSKNREEADASSHMSFEDGSPSESRDSRSLSNFPRDSYESLERVPSATSADNVSSKESFIRKITRKGSSSKFGSWKDRSGLFSKKGEPTQDIEEDGDSEVQPAKSIDSNVSSAPSADRLSRSSLSFFSRKSRKSDKAASETSEKPSERISEFGDDEIPEEKSV